MIHRIAIATHHRRYDTLVGALESLDAYEVLHIRERTELTRRKLEEFGAEWVFFPHWSWMIPPDIHENFRAVIFHMTDVPYGRGGSPLQNLILRGHESTKLTALRCEAELDTGPVYLKRDLSLAGTAEEIFKRASELMRPMIREMVEQDLCATPQRGEPTNFKRRTPYQSAIDGTDGLQHAYDHIRMLDAEGYPHAFAETGHYRIEFTDAELGEDGALYARARITQKDYET
ncbi:methionyl-tRNA formyltransferase [Altererythrobacter sp. SALINAS58]|uniref:methionyl-tRNA formyltransferase n=1 Tax=Alteripontixanthobacter muriae TaxID=2705546 RepID=UPI00157513FC|nr:methionyl-tRNA formyltransferase [Alteripontixanthobacter muriae]NTZ43423.1 methionyl-tRNA formyltransferase [Alteripontixanthobacter muriae]